MRKILFVFIIMIIMGATGCTNSNKAEKIPESSVVQEQEFFDETGLEVEEDLNSMEEIISGSFAISNVATGKNIRPYNAGTADGIDIILYPHHKWKCLTWEFVHVDGSTYQLKNLYSEKTFESVSTPEEGVALWQQPIKDESSQYWEFIKQEDGTYFIRLKDTELYITISSNKTNSPIVLMPKQESDEQKWTLKEQYPRV